MKKILSIALVLIANLSFGQAVIGTQNSGSATGDMLQFQTSGNERARWLNTGTFLMGDVTDPYTAFSHKFVLHETDLVLHGETNLFQSVGTYMYSGTYNRTPTSDNPTVNNSYILMSSGGGGDMKLQGYRFLYLQPEAAGNPVLVNKASITQTDDMLQVAGSVQANGYVAAMSSVITSGSPYTATNAEYTVLVDPGSGTFSVYLPLSNVTKGRIFVVKNVSTTGGDVRVSAGNGTGTTIDGVSGYVTIGNPNHALTLQYDGASGYQIIGSY